MEARVLKKVRSAKARKGTRHWDYGDAFDPTREKKALDPKKVMDVDAEAKGFVATVVPEIRNVYSTFGEGVTQSFGLAWNLRDPEVAKDILQRSNRLAGTVETTWHRVQEAIIDGEAEGETIDGIAKRIGQVFTQAKGYRARVIARTEVVGAANAGALRGATQTGVVGKKTWLAAVDHRTRSTHVQADGQTVAMGKKFAVGASRMDHPGDPAGGASEVVNCRCTMLFVRDVDAEVPEDAPEVVGLDGEDVAPGKPKGMAPSSQVSSTWRDKRGAEKKATKKVTERVDRAKKAIDKVHGSPELTSRPDGLPLIQTGGRRQVGGYAYLFDGRPHSISISSNGDHQGLTFVHEFGHFFDHRDFGSVGAHTSKGNTAADVALFEGWRKAVDESATIKRLRAMLKDQSGQTITHVLDDGRVVEVRPDKGYISYLLSPHEIFARSYAQWIAVESGDEVLLAELAAEQGGLYPNQWADDDFAPIAAAFRSLFKEAGHIE